MAAGQADRPIAEATEAASRCGVIPLSTEIVESAAEPALVPHQGRP